MCNLSRGENSSGSQLQRRRSERRRTMEPLLLLLLCALTSLRCCSAVYDGPLQAEISNGTFHHYFVPDGYYEETEDLEKCQMLFKFSDAHRCGASEDSEIRDDLIIARLQAEEAARLLEGIGRSVTRDLDGEDSYGKLLNRELAQIREAFSGVDKSLVELEVKFKQSQESELREEQQLSGYAVKQVAEIRDTLRHTTDISAGLRDKHELLSLIVRSHGTRLSRLKTQYLHPDS